MATAWMRQMIQETEKDCPGMHPSDIAAGVVDEAFDKGYITEEEVDLAIYEIELECRRLRAVQAVTEAREMVR